MHLNENEGMGTKEPVAGEDAWRKRDVDEQRRLGKNKENGIDIV